MKSNNRYMEIVKTKYFKNLNEWRAWLDKNHSKESKIEVIRYKKHTGKNSPSHMEFMHEAICFGWIDTTIKRLDDEKYIINFSKRTDKSRWSNNTISYGKRMIELGKMHPAGLKRYEEGLRKPILDFDVPRNPKMPKDLKAELNKLGVYDNFDKFAPSSKRTFLRWLERAKLSETRKKRIADIVKRAVEKRGKWQS